MKGTDNDIEKYLKGELTPAERHALEKRALTDPFLADALEGAGHIASDEFTKDTTALNKKIRGGKPMFTPIRIAAGVLILIAAGWMGLSMLDETQPEKLTASEEKPEQPAAAKDSSGGGAEQKEHELLSLNKEEEKRTEETRKSRRERPGDLQAPTVADTEDEPVTKPAETSEQQGEELAHVTQDVLETEKAPSRDSITTQPVPQLATEGLARSEQQSKAKAAGATRQAEVTRADDGRMSKKDAQESPVTAGAVITGKVTLADDGLAIPGVSVRLKGSSNGTVTDLNGNYSLATNNASPVLVFSFIGLQTQEATPTNGTLNVKLAEDISQLSEVVVTGRAIPADLSGEPVIRLAEPVGGLRAYDKYLENNLRYPQQALDNNIKGRVSIQFTVGTDGGLNEFRVLKSLGFGCDEEVIRLVKEGPSWIPSSENNVATESIVRVKMRFDPSKRK